MNHVSAGGEGWAAVSMAPAAGTSCTVPRDQRPMPEARDVIIRLGELQALHAATRPAGAVVKARVQQD